MLRQLSAKFSNNILTFFFATGVICGLSAQGHAAGFYIQEQSVSGLGSAYAGQSAMPRDASILFYNPAGITYLEQAQASLGVHFIAPHMKLKDTGTTLDPVGATPPTSLAGLGITAGDGGNPGSISPVPNGYVAFPITEEGDWWGGFGVSAPFGLGSRYNDQFFGRYVSTETDLQTIDFHPTLAYKPNDWFAFGAGAVIEHIDGNLKRFLSSNDLAVLAGEDWSLGFTVGMMLDPTEDTRIGLNYRSKVNHTLRGDVKVDNALVGSSKASADIGMPDMASLGVAHEFNDKWTGLAQVNWYGWKNFDLLSPVRDDGTATSATPFYYQNCWGYAIGAEYHLDDKWTLRAGYQYDETPTTDEYRSTINPDGDRQWFSAGTTYNYSEKISLDFAATYIDIQEETISQQRDGGAVLPLADVQAKAQNAYVGIVSFAINYKF